MKLHPKFHAYLYPIATVLIIGLASGLIFYSSRQQSITIDEPNHLYCGMEWLQEGTFTAWPENPPLSRMVVALGPYLNGHTIGKVSTESKTLWDHFVASYDPNYFSSELLREKLFWMRIFILPFFLLSAWIVWFWARSLGGKGVGFLAAAMYVTLPPILAHSGLATTDITFLSVFTVMMFCFARWMRNPSYVRGCIFGLSMGAALLTKFSVLAFFPPAALLMVVIFYFYGLKENGKTFRQWCTMAIKSGLLSVFVAFIGVWAFFGFSVGSLGEQPAIQAAMREGIPVEFETTILPAPEWFAGLQLLKWHNDQGGLAYLAGKVATHGFWFFYPFAIFIKTPLPFLLFLLMGIAGAWLALDSKKKRNWEVMALVLLPFVILLAGISSNINIGLRHVLIFYPLGAIGASVGIIRLVSYWFKNKTEWKPLIPAAFVLWQLPIAIVASPQFLSYFNPLAGEEPGELLVDSDLDWGQGMFELAEFCKENKIETLNLSYFGLAQDCWYGLPAIKVLPPDSLTEGWIAVSEAAYRGIFKGVAMDAGPCNYLAFSPMVTEKLEPGKGYRWLDEYPLKRKLGGSIRIYHVKKNNNN